MTIKLGISFRYQQTGSTRQLVEFDETFQYIPLMENLERLLNNADVLQEVHSIVQSVYICVCVCVCLCVYLMYI